MSTVYKTFFTKKNPKHMADEAEDFSVPLPKNSPLQEEILNTLEGTGLKIRALADAIIMCVEQRYQDLKEDGVPEEVLDEMESDEILRSCGEEIDKTIAKLKGCSTSRSFEDCDECRMTIVHLINLEHIRSSRIWEKVFIRK